MRRDKDQMYPMVSAYEQGRKSKRELCEENDLGEGTFWYWVRKYRDEQGDQGFVELTAEDQGPGAGQVEVLLGGGVIRFEAVPSASYLRELVVGC